MPWNLKRHKMNIPKNIYLKEQTEYMQNQVNKIRDPVEDRQSRIAGQAIDKVNWRKTTDKAKLTATSQQDRIHMWKQHFENLHGNPPKLTYESITKIISKQLDIKLGPFTQEELDSVLRKIKIRKAAGFDEIPAEELKTRQFDDIKLRHCNAVYNQNLIDWWMKGYILPFPKKGYLRLAKNYRGITLTSIAAKIYNALLRNRIEPKIDSILRKKQDCFRRNRSMASQTLTIHRILEGIRTKILQATILFVDFTKASDFIHSGKMEQILLVYCLPKETNSLSVIWKSDLTDKMKRSFFQTVVMSILLYGCTAWTLTKRMVKKIDSNYTILLRAICNKSWRQHPTKQQLYGHLPPIPNTIKIRRTKHVGPCWKSRDEHISDDELWYPSHGRTKAGRRAKNLHTAALCRYGM